jgi:predicted ribosome quality control (RQC) complex YloA/Tae2 family protein
VIRDGSGKIQGVRYDELAPMLLNEMQQQQRINASQADEIRILKLEHEEMRTQLAELSDLKQELRAALRQLQSKGELIAQR